MKNKVVKTASLYSFASLTQSIVSMIINIVVLKWVTPFDLGIWQSCSVILTYVPILGLGIIPGLSRELPFLYGKGQKELAHRYANSARTFTLIVSLLLLIITCFLLVYYRLNGVESKFLFSIISVGIIASFTLVKNYLLSTYRSSQSFIILSKIYFIQSIVLCCFIPVIYFTKFWGLMTYHIIETLFLTLLMYRFRPIKLINSGDLVYLKHLFFVGFPMFIATYIRMFSASLPRLFILSKLGVLTLGLYSPVMAIIGICNLLPSTISQFSYPKFTYLYGQSGKAKDLWPIIKKIYFVSLILLIPISIVAWVCIPLIMSFFPNYVDAIDGMRYAVIATIVATPIVTFPCLYSIKAYKAAALFVLCELLSFSIFTCVALSLDGNPITNVSIGILCIQIICVIMNLIIIRNTLFDSKYNAL